MQKIFSKKRIKWFLLGVIAIPIGLLSVTITLLYWNQKVIVQHMLEIVNEDFHGQIKIGGSHISPFANFPYLSIDLEDLSIYPDKSNNSDVIVHVKDAYIGFDLWSIFSSNPEIKAIKLNNGDIHLVQDINGELNITKALQTTKEIENPSEEFSIDLQKIQLTNIDISKLNEENGVLVDGYFYDGSIKFKSTKNHLMISLNADFTLNVLNNSDSTYIKNKHFVVSTKMDYDKAEQLVNLEPSEVILGDAIFKMTGSIDIDNDFDMDLRFGGVKPDFELFIAFAPEELIPTLKRYENKGKVFFDASVKGKSINGHKPRIDANFGCENAFFANSFNKKKIDELQFKGYFTSGEKGDLSTMEFSLSDFSTRPEAGIFKGNLLVKNFESPEIDMQIESDFDLFFLAEFLEIENLKNLKGKIQLSMNFHDIIDLENPEKSLEKINQAYFSELKVTDLSFISPDFHIPIKDIDIHATMKGTEAKIHYFNAQIGKSDIAFTGTVSDLPSIIHHTADLVTTKLSFSSKLLDLEEITKTKANPDNFVQEQIENFSMELSFKSSARAFTESPNLPVGEFFIEKLYAKFKNYPHTLHDFYADVIIDGKDFRIIDFKGEIDKSDFHFAGKLANYDLWFAEHPKGDTKIEFKLSSKLLVLDNLLTYNGVNYLPEDYKHEELKEFKLLGHADLHFNDSLYASDIYFDRLDAKMKIHPLKMENFKGRFHFEDEHLMVENFSGKMGHSSFTANLNYYLGTDTLIRKRDNYFSLKAPRLDLDELSNYSPPSQGEKIEHDSVFNIYELPFTDMLFNVDIQQLNYHNYKLSNIKSSLRTKTNHYIYIDDLNMDVAGGHLDIKGYFNGENSRLIYFSPNIKFTNIDIDELMLKFDNFGQDELVSDNLHGRVSGTLTGKIHMHTDMVPIIDDSEIHLDFEVLNGRLDNYGPILALADFFKDKNLHKVLFDTLKNHIDVTNGNVTIPEMTINTSLGFIKVSGTQDKDMNMEYYLSVPFKMVSSSAATKLFGRKKEDIDPEKEDEIIKLDPNTKTAFVNIKITGTPDNYKISMGKRKAG